MRHRKHTFKIGRTSSHRRAMLANMACSLLSTGRIKTTITRGKEVRRLTEKMITLAKDGSLAARRRAISILGQKPVVRGLFDETGPRFQDRQGGYTRIIKFAARQGDAAEMCFVELVTEPIGSKPQVEDEAVAAEVVEPSETAVEEAEQA